jgi:pyruvate dehydrogenase kinase 2/3/4
MAIHIQAMLATVQRYHNAPVLPPIRATIVAGNDDVGIRISDQGVFLDYEF